MGGAQSIELIADSPSQAEPGTLCVRTSALSDLDPPLAIEDVFDEYEIFFRYPIRSEDAPFVKTVEVQEHDEASFTICVISDGKMLDTDGTGRGDGMDKLRGWRRIVIDRQCWTLSSTWYVDPFTGAWMDEVDELDGKVVCRSIFYAMGDPLHLEICWDRLGVRDASAELARRIRLQVEAVIKACQRAKQARVQVACEAASLKVPGRMSNVSSPIIEDVTYEEFFSSLVSVLQEYVGSGTFCTTVDVAGASTGIREAVVDTADSEQCEQGEGTINISSKRKIRSEVVYSCEMGEIALLETAVTEQGHVARPAWSRVQHCVLHRDPLRVETWGEHADGVHITKAVAARRWQEWVNAALDSILSSKRIGIFPSSTPIGIALPSSLVQSS